MIVMSTMYPPKKPKKDDTPRPDVENNHKQARTVLFQLHSKIRRFYLTTTKIEWIPKTRRGASCNHRTCLPSLRWGPLSPAQGWSPYRSQPISPSGPVSPKWSFTSFKRTRHSSRGSRPENPSLRKMRIAFTISGGHLLSFVSLLRRVRWLRRSRR